MSDCKYEFEGSDVPGVDWYRCTVHDITVLGNSPKDCKEKKRYEPDFVPETD